MTLKPEHIVEELNRTPKLKRDLIMKMMEVMLDSEAFLEAYPTLYDPRIADVDLEYREKVCEEMAQIIVRLFRKNKARQYTLSASICGVGQASQIMPSYKNPYWPSSVRTMYSWPMGES